MTILWISKFILNQMFWDLQQLDKNNVHEIYILILNLIALGSHAYGSWNTTSEVKN
jgi:hypothetical protein